MCPSRSASARLHPATVSSNELIVRRVTLQVFVTGYFTAITICHSINFVSYIMARGAVAHAENQLKS